MSNITDGQVEAFAKSLVFNRIIDKSQIVENKDLMAEAIRVSQSKEGAPWVQYNHESRIGSEITKTPAMNARFPEQQLTAPVHNPVDIFLALYNTRNADIRKEQEQRQMLEEKRFRKWQYLESLPLHERYDLTLGRYINSKDDLKLWPCPHARCLRSFDTEEESKRHAWSHYAQQR